MYGYIYNLLSGLLSFSLFSLFSASDFHCFTLSYVTIVCYRICDIKLMEPSGDKGCYDEAMLGVSYSY